MDSGALLDLLGNENRRRILRLLSHKPCYVTEISEYLNLSPKAVIDHLQKLENAGIIESRVDNQRRKYFRISRNMRLEVNVSPHSFAMKSAYPASASLDLGRCSHLQIDINFDKNSDIPKMVTELKELEELERELSMAQRWVQGRIADIQSTLSEEFGADNGQIYTQILESLSDGPKEAETLIEEKDLPEPVVYNAIGNLQERGLIHKTDRGWQLG